ncbi:alpha/beta hydrolase [Clostridium sp. HBUAS56017]|uniref:alpha/beta hydrolase n=1 Tax=Clostridium sp. HBUAS56017 TaxID=2571128 RepID=UPI001178344F|nr:alpha/beta hydrolase [Clostridium sp. HBUAS56017]
MKEKIIKVSSYYGGDFQNVFVDQESNILVIMFPGSGYINAKPLLYYSNKIALELGFDTLCLNYGFQVFNKDFNLDNDKEIEILVQESEKIIRNCLNKEYKELIFIGKSLGTIVQSKLSKRFKEYKQVHVYLTPVDKTLKNSIKHSCLAISGTKDKKINSSNIKKLEENEEVQLLKINGVGHSLEGSDVIQNIKILAELMRTIKEFLIKSI